MVELHDEFDPWSNYVIYEHEDEELMAKKDEAFLKALRVSDAPDDVVDELIPAVEGIEPVPAAKTKMVKAKGFSYYGHDTGNGERLVKKFGQGIRYVEESNEWMV